jgi:hypothetical protein
VATDAGRLRQVHTCIFALDDRVPQQSGFSLGVRKLGLDTVETIVTPVGCKVGLSPQVRRSRSTEYWYRCAGGRGRDSNWRRHLLDASCWLTDRLLSRPLVRIHLTPPESPPIRGFSGQRCAVLIGRSEQKFTRPRSVGVQNARYNWEATIRAACSTCPSRFSSKSISESLPRRPPSALAWMIIGTIAASGANSSHRAVRAYAGLWQTASILLPSGSIMNAP